MYQTNALLWTIEILDSDTCPSVIGNNPATTQSFFSHQEHSHPEGPKISLPKWLDSSGELLITPPTPSHLASCCYGSCLASGSNCASTPRLGQRGLFGLLEFPPGLGSPKQSVYEAGVQWSLLGMQGSVSEEGCGKKGLPSLSKSHSHTDWGQTEVTPEL